MESSLRRSLLTSTPSCSRLGMQRRDLETPRTARSTVESSTPTPTASTFVLRMLESLWRSRTWTSRNARRWSFCSCVAGTRAVRRRRSIHRDPGVAHQFLPTPSETRRARDRGRDERPPRARATLSSTRRRSVGQPAWPGSITAPCGLGSITCRTPCPSLRCPVTAEFVVDWGICGTDWPHHMSSSCRRRYITRADDQAV